MHEPDWPQRRSPRAQGFDYSNAGIYFVTAVTHKRLPLFGWTDDGEMYLSAAGLIVGDVIQRIPDRFQNVRVDHYVIMPNHVHAILTVNEDVERERRTSLSTVMRAFKSVSAIEVNRILGRTGTPVWQRSFHDRIVRSEPEYGRIWRYIDANPANWSYDHENSQRRERR